MIGFGSKEVQIRWTGKPDGRNFLARNRIISGLSLGILVTEAPKQSGALITGNFALEQGRDVFGVANSIYSPGSVGVNMLIQDGAHRVTNIQDILMALDLFMVPQHVEMQAALPDNSEERTRLALLSHDPRHVDEIIRDSGLLTTIVSSTLMVMELKGMIKQFGGINPTTGDHKGPPSFPSSSLAPTDHPVPFCQVDACWSLRIGTL